MWNFDITTSARFLCAKRWKDSAYTHNGIRAGEINGIGRDGKIAYFV